MFAYSWELNRNDKRDGEGERQTDRQTLTPKDNKRGWDLMSEWCSWPSLAAVTAYPQTKERKQNMWAQMPAVG